MGYGEDEMMQGYLDGFDPSNPEPSDNRSHSYRHGFANGRADKTGKLTGLTVAELRERAANCIAADETHTAF